MARFEGVTHLLGIDLSRLSKEEKQLIEAEFLLFLCNELKSHFRSQFKDYFYLLRVSKELENSMLDADFVRLVIKDILQTDEYTLEGVARYTGIHEDVFYEVVSGLNVYPSAHMLQKTIELHRTVRPDLYRAIIKKFNLLEDRQLKSIIE